MTYFQVARPSPRAPVDVVACPVPCKSRAQVGTVGTEIMLRRPENMGFRAWFPRFPVPHPPCTFFEDASTRSSADLSTGSARGKGDGYGEQPELFAVAVSIA